MDRLCENCWYFVCDGEGEDAEEGFCDLMLDEDEYAGCKYFRPDVGEYGIVRKQN